MSSLAKNNRYYLTHTTLSRFENNFDNVVGLKRLENKNQEIKPCVIVDQKNKAYWAVDSKDINECREIAAARDNQAILFLN